MVIACEIIFDKNPNKIFQSSGYLTGYVQVTPRKEQVVRGIYVKIIGVTTTRWELGRIVRCSKEEFLEHQMSVLNPSRFLFVFLRNICNIFIEHEYVFLSNGII